VAALRMTHVRLLVQDFGRSFRFWRETVGLPLIFGDESGPYAEFDTRVANLAIFDASHQDALPDASERPQARGADQMVVTLLVDKMPAALKELESRGLSFLPAPQTRERWRIRTAYFRDPEGNLIELYEPAGGTLG